MFHNSKPAFIVGDNKEDKYGNRTHVVGYGDNAEDKITHAVVTAGENTRTLAVDRAIKMSSGLEAMHKGKADQGTASYRVTIASGMEIVLEQAELTGTTLHVDVPEREWSFFKNMPEAILKDSSDAVEVVSPSAISIDITNSVFE